MEFGSRVRFAAFTVVGIIVLILAFWGISSALHNIFSGSSKSNAPVAQSIKLDDYIKPSVFVRITVQGPVVANEQYDSYQIEVGQNYRTLKTFNGYTNTITSQKDLTNNQTAFTTFMKALKRYNFTSKIKGSGDDETGFCAVGNRYIYEIYDANVQKFRSWGSSCSNTTGTSTASGSSVRALFQKQIPDVDKLLEKVNI